MIIHNGLLMGCNGLWIRFNGNNKGTCGLRTNHNSGIIGYDVDILAY